MNISVCHGTPTDAIPVLAPITKRAGGMANTILACDNGYTEYPIGFVNFGSRRFNISLEMSVAETLMPKLMLFLSHHFELNGH